MFCVFSFCDSGLLWRNSFVTATVKRSVNYNSWVLGPKSCEPQQGNTTPTCMDQVPLALHGTEARSTIVSEITCLESLVFQMCLGFGTGRQSLTAQPLTLWAGTCHCLVGVHLSLFRSHLTCRSGGHMLVMCVFPPCSSYLWSSMHYLRDPWSSSSVQSTEQSTKLLCVLLAP